MNIYIHNSINQSERIIDAYQYSIKKGDTNYESKLKMKLWRLSLCLDLYHHELGILKPKTYGTCDMGNIQSDIAEYLCYILPHGSGIDADWYIEFLKNGVIQCHNSYHCINSAGYYDGWIDFKVKIFRHKKRVLNQLKGPCKGRSQIIYDIGDIDFKIIGDFYLRWNKYHHIKECLEEFIYDSLSLLLPDCTNRIIPTP